jgi:ABC-2 type transport system permease protein
MRGCLILLRRELGSYFVSWTGYVVISAVVFLIGLGYIGLIEAVNNEPITKSVVEMFFESHYFWLVLLLVSPLITMRTFAREKSTGTFETLMTSPTTEIEVVAAKFLAALIFYIIMWSPLIICMAVIQEYMPTDLSSDFGRTLSVFAGVVLVGFLYMAMGCFASALSRSQTSAAIVGYAFGIGLFILSFLSYAINPQLGLISTALGYINMIEHIRDFARGVIDTRPIVFYLTTSFLFLNLTLRVIESRRWK